METEYYVGGKNQEICCDHVKSEISVIQPSMHIE